MNKSNVVSQLVAQIRWRFRDVPEREVERKLMIEGWSIGAIREALRAAG